VPRGSSILKSRIRPNFAEGEYEITHLRFAGRLAPEDLRQFQYVAAGELGLRAASWTPSRYAARTQQEIAKELRRDLPHLRAVKQWGAAETQLGPSCALYRPR